MKQQKAREHISPNSFYLELPVIHILEESSTVGLRIVMTSNEETRPATEDSTNSVEKLYDDAWHELWNTIPFLNISYSV